MDGVPLIIDFVQRGERGRRRAQRRAQTRAKLPDSRLFSVASNHRSRHEPARRQRVPVHLRVRHGGHPDKVADQISDGVLDAVLADDPYGRVACETLVNTGLIVVSGEISTDTYVDIQEIARETVRKIGYTDAELGFSADSCAVLNAIDKQSPDIAQGVDTALREAHRRG